MSAARLIGTSEPDCWDAVANSNPASMDRGLEMVYCHFRRAAEATITSCVRWTRITPMPR